MLEAVFTGSRAKWIPLYQALRLAARERIGDFDEHFTKSAVNWRYNSSFAEVRAKKDCMVVAVPSDALHDEWSPAKAQQTSPGRIAHYFEVNDESRFPFLLDRIADAYALTQAGKPRKPLEATPSYATIDEYIALYPADIQVVLQRVRETIRAAAPDAQEKISWQMPTYFLNGNLVHFAMGKSHVGLYPAPSAIEAFAEQLAPYKSSKGAVQFPLDKPIPYNLIAEITKFRVREVTEA